MDRVFTDGRSLSQSISPFRKLLLWENIYHTQCGLWTHVNSRAIVHLKRPIRKISVFFAFESWIQQILGIYLLCPSDLLLQSITQVVEADFPFLAGAERNPSNSPIPRRDCAIYYSSS